MVGCVRGKVNNDLYVPLDEARGPGNGAKLTFKEHCEFHPKAISGVNVVIPHLDT